LKRRVRPCQHEGRLHPLPEASAGGIHAGTRHNSAGLLRANSHDLFRTSSGCANIEHAGDIALGRRARPVDKRSPRDYQIRTLCKCCTCTRHEECKGYLITYMTQPSRGWTKMPGGGLRAGCRAALSGAGQPHSSLDRWEEPDGL